MGLHHAPLFLVVIFGKLKININIFILQDIYFLLLYVPSDFMKHHFLWNNFHRKTYFSAYYCFIIFVFMQIYHSKSAK